MYLKIPSTSQMFMLPYSNRVYKHNLKSILLENDELIIVFFIQTNRKVLKFYGKTNLKKV